MTDPFNMFLAAAQRHPERPAVREGGGEISYAAFLDRVRRIAGQIPNTGDEAPRIAILLPQGAWAYAAMFASLMAGGFYVPLNLQMPPQKLNGILDRLDPHAIISAETVDAGFLAPDRANTLVFVERMTNPPLEEKQAPCDLAYVIFTSGSTGEPKGVAIARQSLAHYIAWAHDAMEVTPEDRWSQHPNIAFDLSVLDIYGALCAGACLVPLVSRRDRLMPAKAIRVHDLTIWNSVPSVIDVMHQTGQLTAENTASLRLATFCGEPLLKAHLDHLFAARPDLTVHNTYGPTEATVSCTLLKLNARTYREYCRSSAAFGEAIPGMQVYLEGADPDELDPEEGEIIIAGPQVARGYWKNDAQTAQSFFTTRTGDTSMPAYRTGDWGRRAKGYLYFESRIDRQIKRGGYRLELGEIDAALRSAGAVAACSVFRNGQIIAFVESDDTADCDGLLQRVGEFLPAYAMPDRIEPVDALPRNNNDKIDAGALLQRLEETCA